MPARITTFGEFWPYYVTQHLNPTCRAFHLVGTTNAILGTIALAFTQRWWWIPITLVASYGPAWIGHFFFEKNKPAAFHNPLWSLIADFKMYGLTLSGRMRPELESAARRQSL